MSAYIAKLKREFEESRSPEPKPASLRDRFLAWYRGLPPLTRERFFSMKEFEAALNTQGKYLSPILLEQGWRRIRVWSTTQQYHRYWQPPSQTDPEIVRRGP